MDANNAKYVWELNQFHWERAATWNFPCSANP